MASCTTGGDAEIAEELRDHEAARLLRSPAGRPPAGSRRARSGRSGSARHPAGLQDVDTCAGEFPSATPYLYSSYDEENEACRGGPRYGRDPGQRAQPDRTGRRVRLLLRAGGARLPRDGLPYRHGELATRRPCRPTSTSPTRSTSSRSRSRTCWRSSTSSSRSAWWCSSAGRRRSGWRTAWSAKACRILGTSPEAIDLAEDRGRFEALARELGVRQPPSGVAFSVDEAVAVAEPGRTIRSWSGRRTCWAAAPWRSCTTSRRSAAYFASAARVAPEHPVLIDRFLEDAFEADVDAICDGRRCVIGGVMQHIEDAGIHSGDSACVLPPYLITEEQVAQMREHTRAFALKLGVVGLLNVQYAIRDGVVYVLEVNPRASRTVPFVSKTTGVPLASLAAAVTVGRTLDELGLEDDVLQPYVAVKEAVFPFSKLPGRGPGPGPEMRSTGEVMGIADSFGMAFAKAQASADGALPLEGAVFITVNDHDKTTVVPIARRFQELGFRILATEGTARHLRARGIPAEPRAQGARGAAQRHRPPPVGADPAAGEHAARQAHPAGRLRHSPRGAAAARRPTPRRCRPRPPPGRHHRAPQPGRRGRRSRSGMRWRAMRGMERLR